MRIEFKGSATEVHESWSGFIDNSIEEEIKTIEKRIDGEFTPPAERALRFLGTDLDKVKLIFLGQDPYPQEGVATGRAFEVNGIESWDDKEVNVSLRNVIKLLHKTYMNLPKSASIKQIRQDIVTEKFNILPPNKLFSHWEEEGVLLLNTAFTCRVGDTTNSNSHSAIWKDFSASLISFMNSKKENELTWFLFGGQARSYKKYITSDKIFEANHPCLIHEKEGYFLMSDCFEKTRKAIKWLNDQE